MQFLNRLNHGVNAIKITYSALAFIFLLGKAFCDIEGDVLFNI